MQPPATSPKTVRFGVFEVDLLAGELRKQGVKVRLQGQPFEVLKKLLETPGELVTREDLRKRVWSADTFVDFDQGLNNSVQKIREVLGDSAESPRFVETLPRRGYRFIALLDSDNNGAKPTTITTTDTAGPRRRWIVRASFLLGALALLGCTGFLVYKGRRVPSSPRQRSLTRVTFGDSLEVGATWSPDGRFIAYSSDRGGKFDIWVQQVSGGDPVQITKGAGHHWQPDWSPDGKYIAYRSENGDGGLFIVPALGGAGLEARITSFGYHPRWSPDSSQILFRTEMTPLSDITDKFYIVRLDGSPPREVLTEFFLQHKLRPGSAVWHPDGKRVCVWVSDGSPSPSFWTVTIAGGTAIKWEIAPAITRELEEMSVGDTKGWQRNFTLAWAASGRAVYFEHAYRGARNVWKMTMNPDTLRATAIERLTTGPGPDTELASSPDGTRLAFTAESQHIRTWVFPFDAASGRTTGTGQAITSSGIVAFGQSLSRDGNKMVFVGDRAGRAELWEKSLVDGRETPVITDSYNRSFAEWSPDGTHLAYYRAKPGARYGDVMAWSVRNRIEEPITGLNSQWECGGVWDWSRDGRELLVPHKGVETHRAEVWVLPITEAPHAALAARKIISDPAYDVYQSHFSPDGRWIVFETGRNLDRGVESTVRVISATGGPWIQVTDGKYWDDKPRWAPDGRTIYFISRRGGFFNVWGIRFDPSKGKPVGEPFRVTSFESPSLMIPQQLIEGLGLSLTENKLALTMQDLAGNIWVLDNVDQ
jgi:Tol biopolymer transport system component/DNA-binding winged helix-turn-helix (wHTH) protein